MLTQKYLGAMGKPEKNLLGVSLAYRALLPFTPGNKEKNRIKL